jgi:hypothetical protein
MRRALHIPKRKRLANNRQKRAVFDEIVRELISTDSKRRRERGAGSR